MFTSTAAAVTQVSGVQPLNLILAGTVVVLLISAVLRVRTARARGSVAAGIARAEATGEAFAGVLVASRPEHDLRGAARSTVWSLVVHAWAIVALVLATMSRGQAEGGADGTVIVDLEPEVQPPPTPSPPEPIQVEPRRVELPEGTLTLTMPTIVPPTIPPPQPGENFRPENYSGIGPEGGVAGGRPGAPPQSDLTVAPTFTPRTVEPELKNPAEVERVLARTYPPLQRDSGIGGTVLLWFLIDETGKVVKTQLKESSGHTPLDEAAARVAEVMVFRPAINGDRKVAVWVQIPIVFQTR